MLVRPPDQRQLGSWEHASLRPKHLARPIGRALCNERAPVGDSRAGVGLRSVRKHALGGARRGERRAHGAHHRSAHEPTQDPAKGCVVVTTRPPGCTVPE
jgi:hypothetical protein